MTGIRRHWDGETDVSDARDQQSGLQGSALVLELRRIQEGFDRQIRRQGPAMVRGEAAGRRRAARPTGQGVLERAVDACMEGLGLGNGPRSGPTSERSHGHRAPPAKDDWSGPRAPRAPMPRLDPMMQNRANLEPRMHPHAPGRNALVRSPAPALPRPRGGLPARREVQNGLQHVKYAWDFLLDRAGGAPVGAAPGPELASRVNHSFEKELRTGLRVLVIGVGLAGGWMTLVPLSAAVVVPGQLVAESNVKKVQHPTGGVVAQILVKDGMHVREGDLLVRLDETQTRSNAQVVVKQRDEFRARVARLTAERDGAGDVEFPRELMARRNDPDVEQLMASERAQFKARANSRQSQKELLRTHIAQLGEQIAGFNAQVKSKADQIDLIGSELKGVQTLYEKQLVPLTRLTTLQREGSRLEGERGQLASAIAEAQGKISEGELQIVRVDQDFRTEVTKDLRDAQDKEAEFTERSVAARDQLNRIELRAPTSGVVNALAVHTVGGVVTPAETLMEIVPDTDELQIEARLPLNEIDHVRSGQQALVKFSAFNQRTTPQLYGVVSFVSADTTRDKQTTAAPFYTVRVTLPGEERRRLGSLQLVSGMPTEVFLQTGSRTMMSYLFKPITDQLQRTFTEQ
jgi:HlyD family secretion protein